LYARGLRRDHRHLLAVAQPRHDILDHALELPAEQVRRDE